MGIDPSDGSFWTVQQYADHITVTDPAFTDVVPAYIGSPTQPAPYPRFTQSAIVPPIPEPRVWLLASLCGLVPFLLRQAKRLGYL